MKKSNKNTTVDYLNFLKDLEYELNSFNHKSIIKFPIKHAITKTWTGFLISNNIIFKDEFGCYRWNQKIPVTVKIVNQFRKQTSEYHNLRKLTINKTTGQQKINFKAAPKLPRKDLKNTNKQEVGLIRRFLKWIY
jgi:hypothetical protein